MSYKLKKFNEEVNHIWGLFEFEIEKDDLLKVVNGENFLYLDNDEYAFVVKLKGTDKIKRKNEK